jgi:Flp pilus assembly pilin Flp
MIRNRKRGQSILEYTLVLGAVIAVVVFVLFKKDTGIKDKVQDAYERAGEAIGSTTTDLTAGVFQGAAPDSTPTP